jgi:thioredoxin reductase (NADPH)
VTSPEILIVGAGPAGLTAGLYAARSGHKTTVVERALPGGQVAMTSEVENYPGFIDPVAGMALAQAMELQAAKFGCEVAVAEATGIRRGADGLEVATTEGVLTPGAAIIATGVKPRSLDVPGESALTGRGVSYCAVCDGPLFRGKEVAVVGGGDSALDEALYLSNIVARVHVIHRRAEFRGSRTAEERLRRRPNVDFILSSVVTAANGKDRLESIDIQSRKDGEKTVLVLAGLFVYVGSLPHTGWCGGAVKIDRSGFILTDDRLRTSMPGVFAAGDVRQTHLRQISTAVGDGALAAMMAHDYLTTGDW